MASMTIKGFDDVIKEFDRLSKKSNLDEIAKKAVNAAKDKVSSEMSRSLAISEQHDPNAQNKRVTGSVAGSVKPTAAKVNSYGVYSVAKPDGRNKYGVRHAELAAYLEYGTSKLAARPWRARAVNAAEGPAKRIIEDIVVREMKAD